MPSRDDYDRGRWEGRVEERLQALEEDMSTADDSHRKLEDAVGELKTALQIFNSANKEREAVSLAVASALEKVGRRWYDKAILIVAAVSALAAVAAVVFHL